MQEAIATARQRRPFTILGALIALITLAAFVFVATQHVGTTAPIVGAPSGTASVVVAKTDIKARVPITADMLTIVKMTAADVPAAAFTTVAAIAGTGAASDRHFALIEIKAGQPVLANELVTSSGDASPPAPAYLPIPPGFIAMTIPTSEEAGVAGYIQPGDYIGIIAIFDRGSTTATKTVFNNVHVIRVGTASSTISSTKSGTSISTVNSAASTSLTVVLNTCDAEYLNWFLVKANLKYILEAYSDYGQGTTNNPQQSAPCPIDKATGVTNTDVAKRFGPSLVP